MEPDPKVIANIKACILSKKGGITSAELQYDYKDLLGEGIPYKKYGCEDLDSFLKSISGVLFNGGKIFATSKETKHIENMIAGQKTSLPKKKPKSKRYHPYNPSMQNKNVNKPQSNYSNNPPRREVHIVKKPKYNAKIVETNNNISKKQKLEVLHSFRSDLEEYYYLLETFDRLYEEWEYAKLSYWSRYPSEDPAECRVCTQYRRCVYHDMTALDYKLSKLLDKIKFNYGSDEFTKDILYDNCDEFKIGSDSENIFKGRQLIGDQYLVQLSQDNRNRFMETTPVLAPGMTVKKALLGVRQNGSSASAVVCLGAVDILMHRSAEEVILDMRQLIQTLENNRTRVVLCCVPPMPHLPRAANYEIEKFNRWLINRSGCRALDFYGTILQNRNVFDREEIYVPNCRYPIHIFSDRGIHILRNMIRSNLYH